MSGIASTSTTAGPADQAVPVPEEGERGTCSPQLSGWLGRMGARQVVVVAYHAVQRREVHFSAFINDGDVMAPCFVLPMHPMHPMHPTEGETWPPVFAGRVDEAMTAALEFVGVPRSYRPASPFSGTPESRRVVRDVNGDVIRDEDG